MDQGRVRQILIDQQSEARRRLSSLALIDRGQRAALQSQLDTPLAKVIVGLRRTGKSTLALLSVKDREFIYLNFDDEILGQCRAEDLNVILETALSLNPKANIFVFDEIQNVLGWELFINRLLRQQMNVIVTGSNSRLLSGELATHLTGRQISFEVYPFSFAEYLTVQKKAVRTGALTTEFRAELLGLFHEYLACGGLPELIGQNPDGLFARNYIRELFDKIVTRDIAQRRHTRNIRALKEVALLFLGLYAREFTYQSIRKTILSNSLNTTKNYIDYLLESYLGYAVEPYSNKLKVRVSKPKKAYVVDHRMSEVIAMSPAANLGSRLENLVFMELKRRGHEIYYLHEGSFQVDFALRSGRRLTQLIQVCWSLEDRATWQREVSALLKGAELYGVKDLTIVTERESSQIRENEHDIMVVPYYEWAMTKD